jgi:hypothetical protein
MDNAPVPTTAIRKKTELLTPEAAKADAPIRPTIMVSITPINTNPNWAMMMGTDKLTVSRKSCLYKR